MASGGTTRIPADVNGDREADFALRLNGPHFLDRTVLTL